MKCAAIIVAGGAGKRFGSKTPKQFLKLAGIPVFLWSVLAFKKTGLFSQILLVAPRKQMGLLSSLSKTYHFELAEGGKERSDSVKAGLNLLDESISIVAVHDAARPLIHPWLIKQAVTSAKKYGSGIVAVQAKDTVKQALGFKIQKTIPRNNVWLAQTPQVFNKKLLVKAYAKLGRAKATDDAQVVELTGSGVYLVPGDYKNIKITDKDDFKIAKTLI